MPITQFFLMLARARESRARHYSEMADIAMIPACGIRYFETIKDWYRHQIEGPDQMPEKEGFPVDHPAAVQASSDQAKVIVMSALQMVRRGI